VLEDHCVAPAGWAAALLEAWDRHPHAQGLLHAIENGAPGLLNEASFLLTWAPLLGPLSAPPADRSAGPGVISYRRDVLPLTVPAAGWLEYELFAQVRAQGRLAIDNAITMLHAQPVGPGVFATHFHSGRCFTGTGSDDTRDRSAFTRLRRVAGTPWVLARQTVRGVWRCPYQRFDPRSLALSAALACMNSVGQAVGVLTGSTGDSPRHLE
jgi:hypothetical protein